jgi:hypothetical protein
MRFTTFALAVASFAVPALALDCTVPTSTSTAVTTNGTCACADGWTGPSCNICTSDKACTLLKDAARGMCKANAYSAVKQGNGYCMVDSADISNLIKGTGFIEVKNVVGSSFSFEFFKKPENGAQLSLFSCTSAQATTKADATNGTVTFVGPDLKCQLTCTVGSDKACAPVLANIVKTVGSKGDAQVTCTTATNACLVNENTLNTFLSPGGVKTKNCVFSECGAAMRLRHV